ncbi:putative dehydrogenase [Microbacterium sp. AK009]|uniref:Gfo/Idh/MocA family protein n=1 Tax=Microbacterium sp. AK009 TaxID=2723068 RepID=UPI0018141250|nr:Gfo/Idh/MocA family oxidoreductase [Microbacterium sp. AK009]NYF15425.1 putative dehydrogenase [Microbacterium sp. AK009]
MISSPQPPAPLRVGIVGTGYAGTTAGEAYRAIPGVEVVAVAGKEADRLAALSAAWGVEDVYPDWESIVARDDIDVVSVATPNALHDVISIAALRSGKHVFCEKPLAITAAAARAMVAAATENDRVLEVAFNHRRRADVQWAHRYLEETGVGPIYHARASWKRRSGIPGLTSWFTSRDLAGGGALIDLGPHVIDSLLYLIGEPRVVAVSAVAHGELGRAGYGAMDNREQMAGSGRFEVEDLVSALLRLENGASVALEISWAGHTADDEDISIELLGIDGGLRLFVPRYKPQDTLWVYRHEAGAPVTLRPDVTVAGGEHSLVITEFVDVVRSGDWTGHHGEFALHRTEIIDACYRSAAEGKEVTL